MDYIFFLGLICITSAKFLTKNQYQLYVLGVNNEDYNLGGYSSYKLYNDKVQSLLTTNIKDAFNFVLKYNKTSIAILLSQTTPEKIVFLQLLHSFDKENSYLNSFLFTVAEDMNIIDPLELKHWMDVSFAFPPKKIFNMVHYIATENIYLTDNFTKQMLYLSEKYNVFENAVSIGDSKVIKWILKNSSNSTSVGGNIFENAWRKGQIDIVTDIMKHCKINNLNLTKEIVNEIFNNNETLLHVAVRLGLKEEVDFLVRNLDADINSKDILGRTPLFRAVESNNNEIVELLITLGSDTHSEPLLEQAIIKEQLNTVKVLLKLNVSVDLKNKPDPLFMAVERNNVGILGVLALTHGKENLNVTNDFGDSLMHIASSKGFIESVIALRRLGAASDLRNNYGQTPLYKAVENGSLKVIKELVAAGADVNTRTDLGDTLLHLTATKGDINIAKILLQNHIKIDEKNGLGQVPIYKAAQSGKTEMVNLLISYGADIYVTNNGLTILHEAVREGNENAVIALIDSGFNDVDVVGLWGVTPLHIAAGHGNFRIVEILLDKGANPNTRSKDQWTPLHRAAINGSYNIVKLLLAYGANPFLENRDGETPLQLALVMKKDSVVALLNRYIGNKKIQQ